MKHGKKRFAAALVSAVIFLCSFMPVAAFAEKTGTVRGGWLILRDAPSYSGRKISSYPTGTVVTITGQSGKWYAVTAPDGINGYMLGSYLVVSGDDLVVGQNAWVTSRNGLNVKLRSGPGTKYGAVASYPPGTKCMVLGKYGNFTQIQIGSMIGYMMTEFLTGTDPGTGGGTILYDVGTKAGMIELGTTWSKINVDGKVGYMMTMYLSKTEPSPYYPLHGTYVWSSNGKNVNLRSEPRITSTAIDSIAPGTPVTILTPGTTWHFVKIGTEYGYMMAQFIITK